MKTRHFWEGSYKAPEVGEYVIFINGILLEPGEVCDKLNAYEDLLEQIEALPSINQKLTLYDVCKAKTRIDNQRKVQSPNYNINSGPMSIFEILHHLTNDIANKYLRIAGELDQSIAYKLAVELTAVSLKLCEIVKNYKHPFMQFNIKPMEKDEND